MRRIVRVLTLLLLTIATSALAQENDNPPDRALLLVLDASGSMDRVDGDGVRLIDGAKGALLDLVETLPDDVLVGLRVYGHRYPNDDRVNGCTDTELVVPIGPLDRQAMETAIGTFDAKGFTPIGLSLREAAGDFPPDAATKAIVLVSDGVDTCAPPDPCEVANQLFNEGVFVRIETVGLVLDDPGARDQLQCIADTTGGTYHDAETIDILVHQLESIVEGAIEGPLGLLLGGFTRAQSAALHTCCIGAVPPPEAEDMFLAESGDFRIPIRQGQTLWFSLALQDLQASDFYAVLVLPESMSLDPQYANVTAEGHLEIRVINDAGEEVAGDREGFGPRRSLISELPAVWATMLDVSQLTGDQSPPRMLPGTYYVTITWDAPPADNAGEVSLMVETQEAFGGFAGFIQEARTLTEPQFEVLPGGPDRARATVLPTEFNDEMMPGAATTDEYRIQIHPGEMLWYSIELGDLQALLVGVHGAEVLGVPAPRGAIDLRVYDEDGREVAGDSEGLVSQSPPHATMFDPPEGAIVQLWPGTYHIRIWWDWPVLDDPIDVDWIAEASLGVVVEQVGGQEAADIQRQRQDGADPVGTSTTAGTEPVSTGTDAGEDGTGEEPETGGGSGPLLPVLLGAVVVLLTAGGVWWKLRSR